MRSRFWFAFLVMGVANPLQAQVKKTDPVVGTYIWTGGQTVVLRPDGTAKAGTDQKGAWVSNPYSGGYVIMWEGDYVENLKLVENGAKLAGNGVDPEGKGYPVSGTRKGKDAPNKAEMLVGKWQLAKIGGSEFPKGKEAPIFEFGKDGKFKNHVGEGTYKLDGDKLSMTLGANTQQATIKTLSATALILGGDAKSGTPELELIKKK